MIERLSDAQRRRACRVGFVLLVPLPLLAIIWFIAQLDSRSEWEARCEALLGLKTRIATVHTPRPGTYLFDSVEFSDPEAGWVARIDQMQLSHQEGRWSLLIDQTTIRPEMLAFAWSRLARALDIPAARQENLEIAMRGVHWEATSTASSETTSPLASWDRVTWFREAGPDSVLLTGKLTPAGASELAPIELRFERVRSSYLPGSPRVGRSGDELNHRASTHAQAHRSQWSMRCVVNTHEHSVDLAWLELAGWRGHALGDEAGFRGEFEYSLGVDGSLSCDLAGSLLDVDLRQLVGDRFRHVMDGRAAIQITHLKIRDGRLLELAGALSSDQGVVGLPLLKSLESQLQLQLSPTIEASPNASLPFRNLGIRFELTGETLAISGLSSDVLALGSLGEALVRVGPRLRLRPQDLVRALVPESRYQVPLTRETVALMHWFPLPSREVLEPESDRMPRAVPTNLEITRQE